MLKRLTEKIQFNQSNLPLALIVAGILAYGLQIPFLGLYQDDWHFIHYGSAAGARGMLEFLTMDGRPTAAWVYALGYPLLGFSPLPWQVLSLTLRLLTVLLAWRVLQTLFPTRSGTNALASFFFLLYPAFTLQPQAVVYAEHWTAYALFFGSFLLMLRAMQDPKRWLSYTALAVLMSALQLFTVEYFVGLELLRPLAIWLMFANANSRNERIKRTAQTWLPYFLILVLFLYWRTVFLGGLGLRNNPEGVFSLHTIISTLQNLSADTALVLVTSWFRLVDPTSLELVRARNFLFLAITFIGGLAAYLYSPSIPEPRQATNSKPSSPAIFPIAYLIFSLVAFLLGLAPAYAANFVIHLKLEPWNGRFALAALPGAGMLIALAFEWLISSAAARRVVFAVLIGLLIGFHNRNAFDFKMSWEKQVKFYEQLTWRAPYIEPGTALITDQEILGYMGDYPTSFALNTIYDTRSLRPSPYWFFAMSENLGTDAQTLTEGTSFSTHKYASTFVGDSKDSLIIVFQPEQNQCLWVIRPQDAAYRGLLPQIKTAAQVSNLDRIQDRHDEIPTLYNSIVPENKSAWCFHYERADLARQLGDWKQVLFFWDLAKQGGYSPGHGFEYIPFIQAYAHTGDWKQALALTKQSFRASDNMRTILCPVWDELAVSTEASTTREATVAEAKTLMGCQ
jgi:hypothetical protein